jgi:hypothetical protein
MYRQSERELIPASRCDVPVGISYRVELSARRRNEHVVDALHTLVLCPSATTARMVSRKQ